MTDINKIVPRNGYLVDGETGEKVLFYECDPMKNTECERKLCRAEADEDEGSFGFCSKPLILVFVRTEVGHGMQY